ncbi:MAG: hypothetical protein EXR73_02785 [Myxococcales bacterium]|nr:hypothetical protein [Myxococcales bacterium]
MLDPWIIEEIKRREEQRRRDQQPLVIELPLSEPRRDRAEEQGRPATAPDTEGPRGITVIDFGVG